MIAPRILGPDHGAAFGPPDTVAVGVLADVGDGRVLLQLRDDIDGVGQRGRWCFFGGGHEPGEDFATTAAREFHEETGLLFPPERFRPHCAVYAPPKDSLIIHVYSLKARIEPADIRVLEGVGFGMFTARQLRGLDFIPHLKCVLEEFFGAKVFATE